MNSVTKNKKDEVIHSKSYVGSVQVVRYYIIIQNLTPVLVGVFLKRIVRGVCACVHACVPERACV